MERFLMQPESLTILDKYLSDPKRKPIKVIIDGKRYKLTSFKNMHLGSDESKAAPMKKATKKQSKRPAIHPMQYRLPDGTYTHNVNVYVMCWTELAAKLRMIPGMTIIGYDPGISVIYEDQPMTFPVHFVEFLNDVL
jgi:hypothetical protein